MRTFAFALLLTAGLNACAQQPAQQPAQTAPSATATTSATTATSPEDARANAAAEAAIRQLQPDLPISHLGASALPGFRQAIVDGQIVFISDDGKYLVQGAVFDIAERRNLADELMNTYRAEQLATIPTSDRIIYAPANPQHTVTVLTDHECGYCRRFHQDIAEYNRLGIAVQYIAFPRMGPDSKDFADLVSIWCAPNREQALTDAKNGRRVQARNCDSPVPAHYAVGQRIGLTGTPMIVAANGAVLGGYLPPAQLKRALDAIN